MSKAGKPLCRECRKALKKSANFCVHCGTARHSMGKSFYSEPDPAVREMAWKAEFVPMLTKEFKSGVQF